MDKTVEILKKEMKLEPMRKKRRRADDRPLVFDKKFLKGFWSLDNNLQLEATTHVRKVLSIGRLYRYDIGKLVIQSGVVLRLVEFLMKDDFPQIQLEAAWALTNIAFLRSEHTKVVTELGAVPILVKLLASPSDEVREQAVWALGNVAGDSRECCDLVLNEGALIPLPDLVNEHAKLSMLQKAAWALSNFCRGIPTPSLDQTSLALKALQQLIRSNDEEVLKDACWALSYLSDRDYKNEKIQAVIDANICPRLVELLNHYSPSMLIPALHTVSNLVTGDDMQTQHMIDLQVLPCLLKLLSNDNKSIKKEACRAISRITYGNKDRIQAVIEANIIDPLVNLLQNSETDIKKAAAWAILNAISSGRYTQINYLIRRGCIKPLCDMLTCPDPEIVTDCLEGLENILKAGEPQEDFAEPGEVNLYAQMIRDSEEFEKIELLQIHNNTYIKERAYKLLKTYWEEEDDVTPPGDVASLGLV